MKSFRRIKIINNQKYVYEIQPYYDKKQKKLRQKSTYIGKYEGSLETAKKVRKNLPVKSFDYGEFIPLFEIINELKLFSILKSVLPTKDVESTLSLSLNKIINPVALYAIESWVSNTVLIHKYKNMIYKSQNLSNLLKRLGKEKNIQKVSKSIAASTKTKSTLLYDITSISSYTKLLNIFEYGYNRDNNKLPQINYSLVIDKNRNIPIMFELYSGSIVDVSVLKNTTEKLRSMNIKDCTLILDRGFFSTGNIEQLNETNLNFIIPGSLSNKRIKNTIIKLSGEVEELKNMKKYQKKPLFAVPISVTIGENKSKGYLYFKPDKAERDKEIFYLKLYEIARILEIKINKKNNVTEQIAKKIIEENADKSKRFFIWSEKEKKIIFNELEVNNKLKLMGKFILLYNGDYTWKECLDTYHSRTMIEYSFDMLKNDLTVMPLNIKNEETLRGLLFIHFISMIIRMKLQQKMKIYKLNEKFTFNTLMLELKKIKKIELENGKFITTVLTKKQKEILKHFNYVPK